MTKYAVLGHGHFDVSSSKYPPEILVPPDTKLHFFTDTGQILTLRGADYSEAARRIWETAERFGPPLASGSVTNNYVLTPDHTEGHRNSARQVDWGGAIPFFIESDQITLCAGSADTCPTPKLNVAVSRYNELQRKGPQAVAAFKGWLAKGDRGELPAELSDFGHRLADVPPNLHNYVADGVPPDRWKHHCGGILGKLGGNSNEVYWLCCTQIATEDLPQMPKFSASTVMGPDVGGGAETEDEIRAKSFAENKISVKRAIDNMTAKAKEGTLLPKGETDTPAQSTRLKTFAGGAVAIIGTRYRSGWVQYVNLQKDAAEGETTITMGGDGLISVNVSGFGPKNQSMVEAQMDTILGELLPERSALTNPSTQATPRGGSGAQPSTAVSGIKTAPSTGALGLGDATATGVGVVAANEEVVRAVKLIELAEQEPADTYRKLAIWRLIDELADSVRAAAESIVGGVTNK